MAIDQVLMHINTQKPSGRPRSPKHNSTCSISFDVISVLDASCIVELDPMAHTPPHTPSETNIRVSFSTLVDEKHTFGREEYDRSAVASVSSYFQLMSAHREVQNFKNFEMALGSEKCNCEAKQLRKPLKRTRLTDGRQHIDFFGATSYTFCLGPVECKFAKAKCECENSAKEEDKNIPHVPLTMGYSSTTDLTVMRDSFRQRRCSRIESDEGLSIHTGLHTSCSSRSEC
ncbi:hypothetical protein SARC_10658 [Sphaeroforma arctica JP610]|uniref:Uncharacterized protein n=1 Tax=Sphaeroforma arctica JP610 TaxID=667725 RepID=A0A0L0FJA6_9EUKA|nr:hypothetical protein SARC_10658 [Sphaeroforma arctica JP610]KNC76867.1 hypothetical protein SARC_10658 [Sphaeroforma arctica JP610]|eukprot:XP_014150769.1 hypothetical protein SARC_10658 [Sphaeroforma arctica JP610]